MSAIDKLGGPAFPCDSMKQFPTQEGMSLRDWFAGQALAGYCASHQYCGCEYGQLAKIAIQQADAVMALLYPQPEKENDANNT